MSQTATVEVLTAEVRVLMVGSRQVTLSVARQLDEAEPDWILPFGRIRTGTHRKRFAVTDVIEVIGSVDGQLARSTIERERYLCTAAGYSHGYQMMHGKGQEVIVNRCREHAGDYRADDHCWLAWLCDPEIAPEWEALPLIVLAGLR